jgi:hypothetical protein
VNRQPIITLLTDFGWQDGYIGAMKGVILGINPSCRIVDLAHELPAHDVVAAAMVLGQAYGYFPEGSIHVAVVDPGVGGVRRPLVLADRHHTFVGPDNGLFDQVLSREANAVAYELCDPSYFLEDVSSTFHGRDLFAPVAAHLSTGVPPARMGRHLAIDELSRLALTSPEVLEGSVTAEVVYVDTFGNLVTNITRDLTARLAPDEQLRVELEGEVIKGVKRAYVQGERDELLALWNSWGYLEISLREGNLARVRGWGRGLPVRIRRYV